MLYEDKSIAYEKKEGKSRKLKICSTSSSSDAAQGEGLKPKNSIFFHRVEENVEFNC